MLYKIITCFTTEARDPTEARGPINIASITVYYIMPPQRNKQQTYNKGTLYLAIKAIEATVPNSIKHACRAFNVPKTTLREQRARKLEQHNCKPNLKKLKKTEEEAIVAHILELDN